MNRVGLRVAWRAVSAMLVFVLLLTSCTAPESEAPAQTSTPMIIRETVVVQETSVVEVEKEKVVEVTAAAAPGTGTDAMLNPDVSGEVEFWHFWGSPVRRNAVRRVVAICQEKLPNITVTEVFKPFGDIWTANIAAVAAGSGMPDVIVEDRPKLPQIAADGVEQSLQPFIERDGFDPGRFWPFTWEQTLYEGESYGIPFETDVRVLFYNKNLFEEAGLDPNDPPETWDELWEYADVLDKQNDDGSFSRIAFFPLYGNMSLETWGYTNGVQWVNQDQTVNINDPKAVETVEWIKQWVDRYGGWQEINNFRAQYGAMPNDLFMGNGVAMIVDVAGYNSQLSFYRPKAILENGETPNMDWGVSLIPYNEAPGSWSGGFALSIPTGADNPDAAWEFIKCATGEEAQVSWSRDTFAIPTSTEAAMNAELMADPNWQFFIDAMETSTGGVYLIDYPNWGQELTPRLEQVWLNELEPQEALDQAQEAVQAEIE